MPADPFQKNLKIYFSAPLRGRAARLLCNRAATLRVAGASEGCRFAAAGPNNVRQGAAAHTRGACCDPSLRAAQQIICFSSLVSSWPPHECVIFCQTLSGPLPRAERAAATQGKLFLVYSDHCLGTSGFCQAMLASMTRMCARLEIRTGRLAHTRGVP